MCPTWHEASGGHERAGQAPAPPGKLGTSRTWTTGFIRDPMQRTATKKYLYLQYSILSLERYGRERVVSGSQDWGDNVVQITRKIPVVSSVKPRPPHGAAQKGSALVPRENY